MIFEKYPKETLRWLKELLYILRPKIVLEYKMDVIDSILGAKDFKAVYSGLKCDTYNNKRAETANNLLDILFKDDLVKMPLLINNDYPMCAVAKWPVYLLTTR